MIFGICDIWNTAAVRESELLTNHRAGGRVSLNTGRRVITLKIVMAHLIFVIIVRQTELCCHQCHQNSVKDAHNTVFIDYVNTR